MDAWPPTGGMEEDLTGTLWRDDAWLASFPLTEVSALDYFALSPFYDSSCANEESRRQGLGAGHRRHARLCDVQAAGCTAGSDSHLHHAHSSRPAAAGRGPHLHLPRREGAQGTQYVVHDSQPPHLFVVRKLHRAALQAEASLAVYYVLDGNVYQAPTLHAALLSRMARPAHRSAAVLLASHHAPEWGALAL